MGCQHKGHTLGQSICQCDVNIRGTPWGRASVNVRGGGGHPLAQSICFHAYQWIKHHSHGQIILLEESYFEYA